MAAGGAASRLTPTVQPAYSSSSFCLTDAPPLTLLPKAHSSSHQPLCLSSVRALPHTTSPHGRRVTHVPRLPPSQSNDGHVSDGLSVSARSRGGMPRHSTCAAAAHARTTSPLGPLGLAPPRRAHAAREQRVCPSIRESLGHNPSRSAANRGAVALQTRGGPRSTAQGPLPGSARGANRAFSSPLIACAQRSAV